MGEVRQEPSYLAIQYFHEMKKYPVSRLCTTLHIPRCSYYKWLKREKNRNELLNEQIIDWIKALYIEQNGILGYRQMTIAINRKHQVKFNKKRIRRLMRALNLRSVCRKKHGPDVHKIYLSAILDLYDRRIVAYKIGTSNNNKLVFDTFDEAIEKNPNAHPLFHSDRGFQYTSKHFRAKLDAAKMVQSMSRVGRCIDNGPISGFWGILKSEMYYLRKFSSEQTLTSAIQEYIHFYNTKRYQKRLHCMTPMEFHAAA